MSSPKGGFADDAGATIPSLAGGPLHRLGALLGLVDTRVGRSIFLGLAIAALLWGGVVVLALVTGRSSAVFALAVIGGHVRLLVAIPLFFLCEDRLASHLPPFAEGLRRTGIVQAGQAAAFDSAVSRFNRSAASTRAELVCLVLALIPVWIPLGMEGMEALGTTVFARHGLDKPVQLWYWLVCLPVFRFLLLRWLWRLCAWNLFLWRVSRLDLNLVAIHPDRVAGLGYLSVVQTSFSLLVMAVSAVIAAGIAEEIAVTGASLNQFYHMLLVVVLICLVIFVLPLCSFSGQLRLARARGLAAYMDFAGDYVAAFQAKWIRGRRPDEALLGTADLQSLADLGNSVRVVEELRLVPVNRTMLVAFAAAAGAPMLPLLLFQFPVDELAERAIRMLFGG